MGRLLEMGYRVKAIDAPAHGESPGRSTDVHDIAAALEALLQGEAPVDCLIAHSIGAAASATWISRARIKPAKVVLVAPGGNLADEMEMLGAELWLGLGCRALIKKGLEAHYRRPLSECSTAAALKGQNIALLVVHDRGDRIVPYQAGVSAAQAVKGAFLAETSGLGHRRLLSDMYVVNKVMRFVRPKPPGEFH